MPRPVPRDTRTGRALPVALAVLALLVLVAGCASSPDRSGGSAANGPASSSSPGSSTGGATATPIPYVALGDSYSSAPLVPTTDVAGGCFRSSANYPTLAAAALGARLTDRTCAGATVADLTRAQRPGIAPQDTALTAGTRLVTLGMGGNDEGVFGTLVGTCARLRAQDPQGAPCQEAMRTGGGDRLLAALGRTEDRLAAAVRRIRSAAPDAQVLLVGYPHIVSSGRACARLPLATGDLAWAESVNRALTVAVQQAAKRSGATYVDVWAASRGHDICSSDPWVNGSVTDQRRALAYHPFAVEQQAVARLVEQAVDR